ncbi:MAG: TrkH family potassium uptake protein [Clostridia bacterium]|nr:TrkH family potassium uptake protein [Clostridia bacterium]
MNIKYVLNTIGKILFVEGLLLLFPAAVAAIYGESSLYAYLITAGILLAVGSLSFIFKVKNPMIFAREGLAVVGLGWLAVSLAGALPLYLSREIPTYLDCLFEIVSGFTTTGSSILPDVEALSYANLFWRSFTNWIGGMGVLVFMLAILPKNDRNSMHLMRAEVPGPTVGKIVAKMRFTAQILYAIYIALTAVMVVFLLCGKMPLFDSLVNAFATAGTGGFAIKSASIAAYNSAYIDIVITVFMLIFSVNFTLYYLLLIGSVKQVLKNEELRAFFIIVIVSILLISVNILPQYDSFGRALRDASFQVATIISSTGFATADFNLWPTFSKVILVVLMFVGACAGSTGGGLKISRIIVMVKTAFAQIKHQISPRSVASVKFEGKILSPEFHHGISAYLCAYIVILIGSVFLISFDSPDVTTAFTAVAATLNNIGPGLEGVGPTQNFAAFNPMSKIVLIFDMLAGRLELFPILTLFSLKTWQKR